MKFEDDSQNLRLRLSVIQALVFALLAVLGVRLYFLQVVNGSRYAEIAENQRVRLLPILAPRGAIFDRHGKLLVDSRSIYNIILSREDMRGKDFGALIEPLSAGLGLDPGLLRERFEEVKSQPAFEYIKVKENAAHADIAWVEAHELEFPELRIEEQPQRRYPTEGVLAHVLGYVGEISPEQLKLPKFRDNQEKPYRPGESSGRRASSQLTITCCAGATATARSRLTAAGASSANSKPSSRNRAKTSLSRLTSIYSWPPRTSCATRRPSAA